MVLTSDELNKIATSAEGDNENSFREKLQTASDLFCKEFEKWVETEALTIASKGKRQAYRKYPLSFHDRFEGFRISSFVKGFRNPSDGGFDPSRYGEIGYTEDFATPYHRVRHLLQERGIHIDDVSDSSRGLGFWLKISF